MELLGLIDALEASILSSPKLMLTDKIIVDESKVLSMIDKIRLVLKNCEKVIHQSVDMDKGHQFVDEPDYQEPQSKSLDNVDEVIEKAKQEATQIIDQADNYARDVLEKLHLTVLKVQRNISRMEHTIENSKQMMDDEHIKENINQA